MIAFDMAICLTAFVEFYLIKWGSELPRFRIPTLLFETGGGLCPKTCCTRIDELVLAVGRVARGAIQRSYFRFLLLPCSAPAMTVRTSAGRGAARPRVFTVWSAAQLSD